MISMIFTEKGHERTSPHADGAPLEKLPTMASLGTMHECVPYAQKETHAPELTSGIPQILTGAKERTMYTYARDMRCTTDGCAEAEEVHVEYDEVRSTLTTRLCDIEYNDGYLRDKPWRPCGPFAVMYRVRTKMGSMKKESVPVTNEMLDEWGISKEQLHRDAIEAESSFKATIAALEAVRARPVVQM